MRGTEGSRRPYFAADVLLDEQVLPLVVEDDVNLLGARSADVWTKHDVVVRLAVHVSLV